MGIRTLLLAAVCLVSLTLNHGAATAPSDQTVEKAGADITADREAIKKVVQRYFDVTDKKDYASISAAFHPDARLMSLRQGRLHQMTQEDQWRVEDRQ